MSPSQETVCVHAPVPRGRRRPAHGIRAALPVPVTRCSPFPAAARASPLTDAVWTRDREAVTRLSVGGARIDKTLPLPTNALVDRGRSTNSVSVVATITWDRRIVELLIERGANPRARSAEGRSVLRAAVAKSNTEIAALLVAHGAPLEERTAERRRLLHTGAEHGHRAITVWLLQRGVSVSALETEQA